MVFLLNEVSMDKFKLHTPREYGEGENATRSISILYDNDRFVLQTPFVKCPFGVAEYNTIHSEGHAIAFNPTEGLLDFFRDLDRCVLAEGTWLGLGDYIPLVKEREGKPPLVRIKIQPRHLGFRTIEDLSQAMVPGCRAKFLIQLLPVWVANGKFGISFRYRAMVKQTWDFR